MGPRENTEHTGAIQANHGLRFLFGLRVSSCKERKWMTGPACLHFLHDKLIQVVGPASVRPKKVMTYSHHGPICLLSGGQFEKRTAKSQLSKLANRRNE